jgi:competence protein ComEA
VNRTGALAVAALGVLGLGVLARARWPSSEPLLDCAPEAVRVVDGVAVCGEGEPLPAAWSLALGRKLDLNTVTEEELARVPGVGRSLARKLIEAREERGPFGSWEEVDAVPGVGATRLETLRATMELRQAPLP